MKVEPVVLEGEKVRLEPLSLAHHADLCEAGLHEQLWRLIPTSLKTPEDMKNYIQTALGEQARGISLPFATVEKASGKAIGSTRFGNIDAANKRAEIGWTWIAPEWQRTFVNTEAKYLMLKHAFENWQCNRVELKMDALNERSRNAILRIGAKFEGIFRQHIITESGRLRDSAYFSIINTEWAEVKVRLEEKLNANS
jgi:RimJ/RimL family protein N-acetyltransferase